MGNDEQKRMNLYTLDNIKNLKKLRFLFRDVGSEKVKV